MAFKDDDGRLNNFAREPKVYQAESLTEQEKRNYIILTVITVLLVGGLIAVAIFASSVTTGRWQVGEVIPVRAGLRPVITLARVGEQSGLAA